MTETSEVDGPAFGISFRALRQTPVRDLAIRFAFGAAISATAEIVTIFAGTRFGGLLLAFPAILPATLTLIEKEDSKASAQDDDVGAILGAVALICFGVVSWQLLGRVPAPIALIGATLAWLVVAVVLYLLMRNLFARLLGGRLCSHHASDEHNAPGRVRGRR